MNRGSDMADRSAAGLTVGPGDAALRRLLDRLHEHLAQTEAQAGAALSRLETSLAVAARVEPRSRDETGLRGLASGVLREHRRAAHDLGRLADELGVMAGALEARLTRADQARAVGLRAMDRALRAGADRLEACLGEAEAQVERALAPLTERLGDWEAASAERERRFVEVFASELDAAETRRTRNVDDLLEAVERRLVPPEAASAPSPARPTRRPGSSRSAALLLSAGVACLGLVTLAVVLEPPLARAPGQPQQETGIVLRGPILIAPPRYAYEEDVVPPGSEVAERPMGADAQKALASAIEAVEAGRPGAVARLKSLAEAGLPRAQMYLARMYETGRGGVAADPAEARTWTARAADGGDPVALHNLALYYLQGRGGPRDDALAARLLKRAAASGLTDSQFNLGLLYETGAGVDRNLVEAYKWFQVAANAGDLKARARAVALEDRLSPKELAVAERVATRFAAGGAEPEETVLIPGAATVAEAQKKLARLGLYIGPTDGQDTPAYRQAVEAYRRSQAAKPATIASAAP